MELVMTEPKKSRRKLTLAEKLERIDRSIEAARKKLEKHEHSRAAMIAEHEARIEAMRNEVPR